MPRRSWGCWFLSAVQGKSSQCTEQHDDAGDQKGVEPDIRSGLPRTCQVIPVGPLLHQLIISAASLELDYPLGGREQRIMELILDEIKIAPALSLHVSMPRYDGC